MSPSVSARLLLTQSDARLVAFAHAGHERAFEALVQRYRRPLLGYCRRLLLSPERAEDTLQQALLQAWLALRAGTEVGDVKPWLYRIVHNAALNALRVSGYDYCKLNESLSGADAPQEDLDRRIAVREALAGLAALPEMQREALLRTAVEGRTHQQVARDLGLSENALRGLVYRARSSLRATVSALMPPPLVSWALGSGGRGAPVMERLAELGAGGGSAGVAGLLMKGGAVAVTASVLAGGIAAMHTHPKPIHEHSSSRTAHHRANRASTALALAAARTASASAMPVSQWLPSQDKPSTNRPPALRPERGRPRSRTMPFTTKITPPNPLPSSNTRQSRDGRGRFDGGERNEEPYRQGSGSGDSSRHSDEQGSYEGSQSSHNGGHDEGSPGDGRSGGSSAQSEGDRGANSSGDARGEGSAETSQPEGSHDHQGSSAASSSKGTNSSSKDESSTSEGKQGD
jgi:RNA polymerase sigma factor (sigma-70 family)